MSDPRWGTLREPNPVLSAATTEAMQRGLDACAEAAFHARQAERTPTPEETTVTDTPASTEAEACNPPADNTNQGSNRTGKNTHGSDRPAVTDTLTPCVSPRASASFVQGPLPREQVLAPIPAPASDPAPRVLVDEADLRAVPLHKRLTKQEREVIHLALDVLLEGSPNPDFTRDVEAVRSGLSTATKDDQ